MRMTNALVKINFICIKVGQVVIAITLTPVRHKRYMQFLTPAPNFIGSAYPPHPAFPSP